MRIMAFNITNIIKQLNLYCAELMYLLIGYH
jgi:hypothetical protein